MPKLLLRIIWGLGYHTCLRPFFMCPESVYALSYTAITKEETTMAEHAYKGPSPANDEGLIPKLLGELYEAQDHHLRLALEAADKGDLTQWQKMQDIAAGIRIAIDILIANDPRLNGD